VGDLQPDGRCDFTIQLTGHVAFYSQTKQGRAVAAKTGEISWGGDSGRHWGWVYRAAAGGLSENRIAAEQTIRAGFSSKRYRKGTCLVQEHPVTGWI
jgi:hypothetical protein